MRRFWRILKRVFFAVLGAVLLFEIIILMSSKTDTALNGFPPRQFVKGNQVLNVRQEFRSSSNKTHWLYLDAIEKELMAIGWKDKEFKKSAEVATMNMVSPDLIRVISITPYSDTEGGHQYEVRFTYTQQGMHCLVPLAYSVPTLNQDISQLKEILQATFIAEPYFIKQAENMPCEDAKLLHQKEAKKVMI